MTDPNEMALVLKSSSSGSEDALAPRPTAAGQLSNYYGDCVHNRRQLMALGRLKQKVHHHPQIWTKDPHGGKYHQVPQSRKPSSLVSFSDSL